MAELKYSPIAHDHMAFLVKAGARRGFKESYDALELEYELAGQLLKARTRAGRRSSFRRCHSSCHRLQNYRASIWR